MYVHGVRQYRYYRHEETHGTTSNLGSLSFTPRSSEAGPFSHTEQHATTRVATPSTTHGGGWRKSDGCSAEKEEQTVRCCCCCCCCWCSTATQKSQKTQKAQGTLEGWNRPTPSPPSVYIYIYFLSHTHSILLLSPKIIGFHGYGRRSSEKSSHDQTQTVPDTAGCGWSHTGTRSRPRTISQGLGRRQVLSYW